jgi:hypothetical protein
MPKFLEEKLRAGARNKGFKGRRADRYVYGAMNNMGAMRGNKETAKGAEMEAKHRADMKKYSGSAASYKHSRPVRKVVRRSFGNA